MQKVVRSLFHKKHKHKIMLNTQQKNKAVLGLLLVMFTQANQKTSKK
jgi:hypothetical protein